MKGKRWHRWFVRELLVFVLSCFIVSHLIQGRNHRSSQVNLSVDNDIEARLRLPLDFISPNAPKNVGTTTSEMNGKSCASWISAQRRKILFVELHTWEMYYGPSKYKTGEYYVSSTWDYALRRNEFEVHRVSTRHFFERMRPSEMRSYHRIFLRDPKWHPYFRHHDILCRIRPMYYFGEWYQNKVNITWFQWPFDRKQILVAHPEAFNTFMGYFPHNLIVDKTKPKAERGRVGLLYGKKPEYFVPHQALIQRLVNEGFELHSTCTDTSETMKCPFPKEVIQHQNIGPTEYASLLNNFSFMLGFQKPPGSPSPMVGLSYGVSFLNPIREDGEADYTQHKALSRLGMPYVYNINLTDHDTVVQAATWATIYRFSSYVPADFRVESLVDRMCALLEDDALCSCPNPLFGDDQLDMRLNQSVVHEMDCRASTYIKKAKIFPRRDPYVHA